MARRSSRPVNLVNVHILYPNRSVVSMQDEVDDGSVLKAFTLAHEAYLPFSAIGIVNVHEYSNDLLQAIKVGRANAAETEGPDLMVILSDGNLAEGSTREEVEDELEQLEEDFFIIVDVNNQPDTDLSSWLAYLDDDSPFSHQVDCLSPHRETLPGTEVYEWIRTIQV